jgi:putative sterol carrier protein
LCDTVASSHKKCEPSQLLHESSQFSRKHLYTPSFTWKQTLQGEIMEKEERADTLMEKLREKLDMLADSNKGWNKKIQISFDDIEKVYIIKLGEDGTVQQFDKRPLGEKDESADATVYMTVDVIEGIMKKEINPMMAMMQGKVRIEGDMSVLTKLAPVFM